MILSMSYLQKVGFLTYFRYSNLETQRIDAFITEIHGD